MFGKSPLEAAREALAVDAPPRHEVHVKARQQGKAYVQYLVDRALRERREHIDAGRDVSAQGDPCPDCGAPWNYAHQQAEHPPPAFTICLGGRMDGKLVEMSAACFDIPVPNQQAALCVPPHVGLPEPTYPHERYRRTQFHWAGTYTMSVYLCESLGSWEACELLFGPGGNFSVPA